MYFLFYEGSGFIDHQPQPVGHQPWGTFHIQSRATTFHLLWTVESSYFVYVHIRICAVCRIQGHTGSSLLPSVCGCFPWGEWGLFTDTEPSSLLTPAQSKMTRLYLNCPLVVNISIASPLFLFQIALEWTRPFCCARENFSFPKQNSLIRSPVVPMEVV